MARLYEIKSLPFEFEELLRDSVKDGQKFLQRLQNEWASGVNRFTNPGGLLLAAFEGERLVGIGGTNIDPYLQDSKSGRVRNLYIHSEYRRQGIARMIMQELESHARHHFTLLTLRTHNSEAFIFYASLGFTEVKEEFVTHKKIL